MDRRNPSSDGHTVNPSSSQPRCKAHTPRGPCKLYPVHGTTVCHKHGASAPQVKTAATRRLAVNEALAELARRGITPVENPLAALAELAGEIVEVKNIFRERAAELEQEEWRYEDAKGSEQLREEIALYERALDRSVRVLADIARLKIDERLMAVTQQQGQALANVIVSVLERLDLGEQATRVRDLVAAELDRMAA